MRYQDVKTLACRVLATPRELCLALGAISLAGLAVAYFTQYGLGLEPCPLCWYQRYAHFALVGFAALGWFVPRLAKPALAGLALSALTGMGIAIHHVGVEEHWWVSVCAAPDTAGLSPEELLQQLQATPTVPCDKVPWRIFGLSMAAWNGVDQAFQAAVAAWGLFLARK